jgi:hypothetical protein
MTWKKWAASTLGAAAIIGAFALANVAAAAQASPEPPAGPATVQMQEIQAQIDEASAADATLPAPTNSPATDPGPFPFCATGATRVGPEEPSVAVETHCFATQAEVLGYIDEQAPTQ